MNAIALIYCRLIKLGLKTLDDVPDAIRDEVKALLDAEQAG
jgi:hypothetical protein